MDDSGVRRVEPAGDDAVDGGSRGDPCRVEPAAAPGVEHGFNTMFTALYGALTPHPWRDPVLAESDAYSLFYARSAAMGWLTPAVVDASGGEWGMNDAGQDAGSESQPPRVAWFQTTVNPPVADRPLPVQAFLACAGDVAARIGTLDLQAVQVLLPVPIRAESTGSSSSLRLDALGSLLSANGWFVEGNPHARTEVQVTLDSGQDSSIHSAAPEVFRWIREIRQDVFSCESFSLAHDDAVVVEPSIDGLWLGPGCHRATFRGNLAEWSLDALGWLTAFLADASSRYGVTTPVMLTATRSGTGGSGPGSR